MMASWLVFIALTLLSVLAVALFVPEATRRRYADCRAPVFWLAHLFRQGIWIVAAVQASVAPSSFAGPAWILGVAYMVAGHALSIWAMRVNPEFSPLIERPARLATGGPYRRFSHPGYWGFACSAAGTYLLLGQRWALVPLALYLCLLTWRARVESRFLASLQS